MNEIIYTGGVIALLFVAALIYIGVEALQRRWDR